MGTRILLFLSLDPCEGLQIRTSLNLLIICANFCPLNLHFFFFFFNETLNPLEVRLQLSFVHLRLSDLLGEHLQEIRALRKRLEESILTNDRLREQLEKRLAEVEKDPGTLGKSYLCQRDY